MLKNTFFASIAAGLLIAIGGSVFLACDNRYIGALLFSVALLSICFKGLALFTGKIGYAAEDHSLSNIASLAVCLLGNAVAVLLSGAVVRYAIPSLGTAADALCSGKLELPLAAVFIRAVFCGVLMYLAVSIYKEKNSVVGIIFCVPVFILSGFEHSVADLFYFGTALSYTPRTALFILLAVAGNTVGALILPLLSLAAGKGKTN